MQFSLCASPQSILDQTNEYVKCRFSALIQRLFTIFRGSKVNEQLSDNQFHGQVPFLFHDKKAGVDLQS